MLLRRLTLATRVFRSKTFYAWAMVSNLVGRFAWAVTITPHGKGGVFFILNGAGLTGDAAGTFVAVLELLRRAQWTFLRLENEYLNNSARYRSVVAAPMLLDDVGSSNWDSEWKFEREVRRVEGGGVGATSCPFKSYVPANVSFIFACIMYKTTNQLDSPMHR